MKRLMIALAILLCLPGMVCATNAVAKSGNFVTVTFDGTNYFDLCEYLHTTSVTLYAITQNAVAANDVLTVRDGSATGVAIYGPFKDVSGGGLIRYYSPPRVLKPYVKGTEATAGSKATFEVQYVK